MNFYISDKHCSFHCLYIVVDDKINFFFFSSFGLFGLLILSLPLTSYDTFVLCCSVILLLVFSPWAFIALSVHSIWTANISIDLVWFCRIPIKESAICFFFLFTANCQPKQGNPIDFWLCISVFTPICVIDIYFLTLKIIYELMDILADLVNSAHDLSQFM